MKENPWLTISPKQEDEAIYGKSVKCNQCGCNTHDAVENPRDNMNNLICRDCLENQSDEMICPYCGKEQSEESRGCCGESAAHFISKDEAAMIFEHEKTKQMQEVYKI